MNELTKFAKLGAILCNNVLYIYKFTRINCHEKNKNLQIKGKYKLTEKELTIQNDTNKIVLKRTR